MADIKSPDESLSSYFDDLLGGDEASGSLLDAPAVQPANWAAASGRVVPLPHKTSASKPPAAKKKLNLVAPVAHYAEPEPQQSQEQKQKLEKLLQSARTQLLMETATAPEVKVEESLAAPVTQTAFQYRPDEIQEWEIEAPAAEALLAEPSAPVSEPVEAVEDAQLHSYQLEGVEWLENGRPVWAQSRFDVLLFSVSGLTLAVPLVALGQIQPLTDELTPLFGQADWFMGLQPTNAGKIRTVNTAKFVMPERYDPQFLTTAKYVVSINGVPWGLAVDSVNQPITLHPDDVKWRSDRSKRPWLAGTVKEHMCALLDIPRIGQMLIEADKNFNRSAAH